MGWHKFLEIFLTTVFLLVTVLLIIVVLLQKGRGGGLSAAFGGGGGGSAFGTKTGDVFTWVTIVLTALFLLLAITVTLVFRPTNAAAPVAPEAPQQLPASPMGRPAAATTLPSATETAPAEAHPATAPNGTMPAK